MKAPGFVCILLTLCVLQSARGAIRLHPLFADGAVLQRDRALPVWGWASPGEKVTVSFARQTVSTTADAQGQWLVKLSPLPASAAPGELVATGTNTVTVREVLVGDVWLASGQSNMAAPVSSVPDAAAVIAAANDPQLRFFTVPKRTAVEPQATLSGAWQTLTPANAGTFSAVAYYFIRELRQTQGVPMAVINASWGGTPVQTWISLAGLERAPAMTKMVTEWTQALAQHRVTAADPSLGARYEADLKQWQAEVAPAHDAAMKAYNAAVAAGRDAGPRPVPVRPEPSNPDPMGMPSPSRRPQTPAVSFNGMVAPLVPFALRGVIWYQGEQNNGSGADYAALFRRLIEDWRHLWSQPELPFLYVQLPANGPDTAPVARGGWPLIREAQRKTLAVPHTGMAITLDIGNPRDVHPQNKVHVGHRLALQARQKVYGETLVASGPLFERAEFTGGRVILSFQQRGSGLVAADAPWHAPGVPPFPTDRLIGFFLAGADRQWVEAQAVIEGDQVIVTSPAVAAPVAVRYGWAQSPRANLYNREGLPASPFRTDDWP
jgi:sialate O-acetylesterase